MCAVTAVGLPFLRNNFIKDGTFCARSTDRAVHGNVVRGAIAAGQAVNAVEGLGTLSQQLSIFDKTVGKSALSAVEAIEKAKISQNAMGYAASGVDFARKNINPLICAATAFNIVRADDKEKAIMTDGAGLAGMFAGEKLAKIGLAKAHETIGKSVVKVALKFGKTALLADPKVMAAVSIIEGLTFVTASIASWKLASNIGAKCHKDMVAQGVLKDKSKDKEKVDNENKENVVVATTTETKKDNPFAPKNKEELAKAQVATNPFAKSSDPKLLLANESMPMQSAQGVGVIS